MERYLTSHITKDLPNKLVLVSGPRQSGKTTLAKNLYDRNDYDYFNYDAIEDRLALTEKSWDRSKQLIIFDELHKKKDWKRWLKGVYDTEGIPPQIIVTGSAMLDVYHKAGDSLAGRYFSYRLHPIDLKEAKIGISKNLVDLFEQLWDCSGFPEPFLKNDKAYYRRWRRSHLEIILRQDLIDLHTIRDIKAIETLVELLKQRVGSTVSYANLARDLERDPKTIKAWLQLLENLYIIFSVKPFHKNIARSLLKEPKYYFYDHTYAEGNDGARLENLVACALLKELNYIEDTKGLKTSLHYLRTKDGKELDFLISVDNKPVHAIEVKFKNDKIAAGFEYYQKSLGDTKFTQLVKELKREKTYPQGLEIRNLITWLANFKLLS